MKKKEPTPKWVNTGLVFLSMPKKNDDLPRARVLTIANRLFKTRLDNLDIIFVKDENPKSRKKVHSYIRVTKPKDGCDGAFIFRKKDRRRVVRFLGGIDA